MTKLLPITRRSPTLFRLCAWAQILLLLVNYVSILPATASSSDLSFSDLTKLSSLESVIYGSSHKNLPSEKRIGSLERIVLGKPQKGPLPQRLAILVSTINGEHKNLLAPPIAPELDRSDTLTKTPAPPLAPQAAAEINGLADEMPPTAQEDRVKVMLSQAMQLYSGGQTDQAEAIFKNVLALDSHNSDANFNLGAIAEGRSDWQGALHYYQAAASAQPDDKDIENAVQSMQAKIKKAQISANANQSQASSNQNKKLSQAQMDSLRQRVSQAASYYQSGNYQAAVGILREVDKQIPNQADVQYALGQAYKAEGQNSNARSALAQAVSIAPNNADYRNALSDLDHQMASGTNNTPAETFGNNTNNNSYTNNSGNQTSQNNGPIGQITPFAPDNNSAGDNQGWQSAQSSSQPSTRFYSGNSYASPGYSSGYGGYSNYMPGYVSGYSPYGYRGYGFGGSAGTAAMAGLAGMAIGSMFSLIMSRHRY